MTITFVYLKLGYRVYLIGVILQVEIHMRYIELQRALQSRLNKLERLCEQERSILMGKWKTHSLPARKRTGNSATGNDSDQPLPSTNFGSTSQCCRPTASSEHLLLYNVVNVFQILHFLTLCIEISYFSI